MLVANLLVSPLVQFVVPYTSLTASLTGYGALIIASAVLSFGLYIRHMLKREDMPPISAWGLWCLIDMITVASEIGRGVFNMQMIAYTTGSIVVCIILLRQPKIVWDAVWDNLTVLCAGLAIVAWLLSGNPTWGLWLSLAALWIAAMPMLRMLYTRTLNDEPLGSWSFVLLGGVFAYLDGLIISSLVLGVMQVLIIVLIIRTRLRVPAPA